MRELSDPNPYQNLSVERLRFLQKEYKAIIKSKSMQAGGGRSAARQVYVQALKEIEEVLEPKK
jgi:hypothetical protein